MSPAKRLTAKQRLERQRRLQQAVGTAALMLHNGEQGYVPLLDVAENAADLLLAAVEEWR